MISVQFTTSMSGLGIFLYRKSLAVRLDSFVNLMIPIKIQKECSGRQIERKTFKQWTQTPSLVLANTMIPGGLPRSAKHWKDGRRCPCLNGTNSKPCR